jgi:YidC/Oxa1 family membrane protein insertase
MEQRRFILALILSAAVLIVWEYLFRPSVPQTQPVRQPVAQPTQQAQAQVPLPESVQTIEEAPPKTITISTSLYEAKFSSRGAVLESWILKKNKDTGRPLYSVGRDGKQPLELISPIGLERGEAPLQIRTGDQALDTILDHSSYSIVGVDAQGDVRLELEGGQTARLDFVLRDPKTGIEAIKTVVFDADRYGFDLILKLTRDGNPLPEARLAIGPSIGDQGIPRYTFYSVPPEGVAIVDDEVKRVHASSVHKDDNDVKKLQGKIDWAGVGDTYFAMVAIPQRPVASIEYRTERYEHQADGQKEERFLITGLMAIPTDGFPLRFYVGPKDHYLLQEASATISSTVGRPVDLERLIDYGFLASLSRPLAVPILWAIKRLYGVTGSYGAAIIIFTIAIYSLFFPLKWRSTKAMKRAQKVAPRMKELQERLKRLKPDDPRYKELQMEQLKLMKEANFLGGCMLLLIQMPFIFALYRAITISLDFRQASFLWMPDLSAADPLHILPILMAISMFVLQIVTPSPSDDPAAKMQRNMMAILLPVMMLYMLWRAPSGLLVYWFVGNLVGFGQQLVINRMLKSEDDEPPPTKRVEVESRGKGERATSPASAAARRTANA